MNGNLASLWWKSRLWSRCYSNRIKDQVIIIIIITIIIIEIRDGSGAADDDDDENNLCHCYFFSMCLTESELYSSLLLMNPYLFFMR